MDNSARPQRGPRKIVYLEDPKKRMITFYKRRAGLKKKAEELAILTGTKVTIYLINPKTGEEMAFSYGPPVSELIGIE